MSRTVDNDIHLRIAALVQQIHHSQRDVDEVLSLFADAAVEVIPGARYADITVSGRRGHLQTAGATHAYASTLDEIAHRHKQGPCFEAVRAEESVISHDLENETRWPRYCREAATATPIRSVLSLPLPNHTHTLGALNVYAEATDAFSDEALVCGRAYSIHAALAWEALRRVDQFTTALASRDIIGQAKGILMERFGIDADASFELLRTLSQESNTPLRQVATAVLQSQVATSGP